jgi:hypothetical protein
MPYEFLLLHMVIVNPNTELKERTRSANKANALGQAKVAPPLPRFATFACR